MTTEFFMPMKSPTITDQMHRITKKANKVIVYDSPELKEARAKLMAHLARHKPEHMFTTAVRLTVKWLFPIAGRHWNGEYKYTKPDTDNLQKMLKDCMTKTGFWKDDALVASEIIEKFWANQPGIYIRIDPL